MVEDENYSHISDEVGIGWKGVNNSELFEQLVLTPPRLSGIQNSKDQ